MLLLLKLDLVLLLLYWLLLTLCFHIQVDSSQR